MRAPVCILSCWGAPCPSGVDPVPLGCTYCPPLPLMAIPVLMGRDPGVQWGVEHQLPQDQGSQPSLGAGVVPDCVGATLAPLLPACWARCAPETASMSATVTIVVCKGPREGECKLGTAPTSLAPVCPPACTLMDSSHLLQRAHQGCAGRHDREDRWTDPGGPLLPSPCTALLALLLPLGGHKAPAGSKAMAGTHVWAMWLQRDCPRLHRVFGGSSEEVLSLSQTCMSGSSPPPALLAWPDCPGHVFVPRVIPSVLASARPGLAACTHGGRRQQEGLLDMVLSGSRHSPSYTVPC